MSAQNSSPWFKKIAGWIKDPLSIFISQPSSKSSSRRKKITPKKTPKVKKLLLTSGVGGASQLRKPKLQSVKTKVVSNKKKSKLIQKQVKVLAKKKIMKKLSKSKSRLKIKASAVSLKPIVQGVFVGKITHYFQKAGACAIKVEKAEIKEGASIRIYGPVTDFKMTVKSIQINRIPVPSGKPGEDIGMGVSQPVAVGDSIYLV